MTTHPGAEALKEIVDGLDGVTPGPYLLCAHLRSPEGDKKCSCGYRGGIWGGDCESIMLEMGAYANPGEECLHPRYDRPTELTNAAHFARCYPEAIRSIAAYVAKLEADNERLRNGADLTKCTAQSIEDKPI